MTQKFRHSLYETGLNLGSGFIVSWATGQFILPLFGFPITVGQGFWLTVIYTIISVIRSLIWRRTFNWLHATGRLS